MKNIDITKLGFSETELVKKSINESNKTVTTIREWDRSSDPIITARKVYKDIYNTYNYVYDTLSTMQPIEVYTEQEASMCMQTINNLFKNRIYYLMKNVIKKFVIVNCIKYNIDNHSDYDLVFDIVLHKDSFDTVLKYDYDLEQGIFSMDLYDDTNNFGLVNDHILRDYANLIVISIEPMIVIERMVVYEKYGCDIKDKIDEIKYFEGLKNEILKDTFNLTLAIFQRLVYEYNQIIKPIFPIMKEEVKTTESTLTNMKYEPIKKFIHECNQIIKPIFPIEKEVETADSTLINMEYEPIKRVKNERYVCKEKFYTESIYDTMLKDYSNCEYINTIASHVDQHKKDCKFESSAHQHVLLEIFSHRSRFIYDNMINLFINDILDCVNQKETSDIYIRNNMLNTVYSNKSILHFLNISNFEYGNISYYNPIYRRLMTLLVITTHLNSITHFGDDNIDYDFKGYEEMLTDLMLKTEENLEDVIEQLLYEYHNCFERQVNVYRNMK